MSAIDERPTRSTGKSTQDGARPSAGGATRVLMLPQLPYADAVHTALRGVGLLPACYEAGLRRGRTGTAELFVRAVWPVGAPALAGPARSRGLTIAWSHVTGWSAHDAEESCALLDVDALAAPELVADAAGHHARHGVDETRPWVAPADGRWSEAVYLDLAIARFKTAEVNR
ncbi:hypothetical protein [Streptomyces sp. STCH 565 A]|uniref:hypothetical protein n=1 Tax=Streptomyces sp. STCH 565 A TaxID=2950532 RepID=UPI00207656F3|nr:hypothetical protein [Streptomyces sp. STCH 565 A]MCM8550031.1 hypothetical protein [Streptomyces sp. STCH 565 A]